MKGAQVPNSKSLKSFLCQFAVCLVVAVGSTAVLAQQDTAGGADTAPDLPLIPPLPDAVDDEELRLFGSDETASPAVQTSPGEASRVDEVVADDDPAEPLSRGPLHEAFAEAVAPDPEPTPVIAKPKPLCAPNSRVPPSGR